MIAAVYGVLTTVGASVLAGMLCMLALMHFRRHQDANGRTQRSRLALALLQGAALYSMVLTVFGHYALKIPVAQTIGAGFGSDRFAFLLLGLSVDVFARLVELFDRE